MVRRKLPGLVVLAIAVIGISALMVPRGTAATPRLAGTGLHQKVAPDFSLRDQFRHAVTLSRLRDKPVILTFLQAHCRDACPIVADKIRYALTDLGPAGRNVAVVVVSADPEGDTFSAVQQFSSRHGMLHRWHYLTGSRQQLAKVWRDYAIFSPPKGANQSLKDIHTSATYLIDGHGRERVLFVGSELTTTGLDRDLRILLGLPVTPTGKEAVAQPLAGYPAPSFALQSINGSSLSLASFRGSVVLLNFWATWCIPCRTEMPELAGWYHQYHGRGLVILGIDKQENRSDVMTFLHQTHVTYPVVLDANGDIAARYDVSGLPTSFLIDRQGVIQSVRLGMIDRQYLTEHILPLLAAGG